MSENWAVIPPLVWKPRACALHNAAEEHVSTMCGAQSTAVHTRKHFGWAQGPRVSFLSTF